MKPKIYHFFKYFGAVLKEDYFLTNVKSSCTRFYFLIKFLQTVWFVLVWYTLAVLRRPSGPA